MKVVSIKVIGCVVLLFSGYCAPVLSSGQDRSTDTPHAAESISGEDSISEEYKKLLQLVREKKKPVQTINESLDISGRPGIGDKNSRVVLVEFGDFQCPFCRRHFFGVAQQIRDHLVATNQLRYVFLDYPNEDTHPFALNAAIAARCAEEQGKYWQLRTILYENQKALFDSVMIEHARNAGLDESSFSECLASDRYISSIRKDKAIGESLGVTGTPPFFLGLSGDRGVRIVRKILGSQPYKTFEREILVVNDLAVASE